MQDRDGLLKLYTLTIEEADVGIYASSMPSALEQALEWALESPPGETTYWLDGTSSLRCAPRMARRIVPARVAVTGCARSRSTSGDAQGYMEMNGCTVAEAMQSMLEQCADEVQREAILGGTLEIVEA